MKYLISILMLSISTFAQGVKLSGSFSTGNLTAGTINSNQVSHTHNIYILGDSIPSNVNNLASLLGFPWTEINRGIGGDTTTGMLHRSTNEIVNGDAEAVVVSGGYNDLFASATVGTIETNLQTIFNNAHTAGIKVIALSLTPSKTFSGWTSTIQTNTTNINYWILNTASNVDFRINTYTNLVDPSNADTLLPAYDSGDHLHLSTLGYATMGSNIVKGITVFPSTNMTLAMLSGKNAAINQDLRISSKPVFSGITVDTDTINVTGDNNHYVGIGTAIPGKKLDVVGDIRYSGVLYGNGGSMYGELDINTLVASNRVTTTGIFITPEIDAVANLTLFPGSGALRLLGPSLTTYFIDSTIGNYSSLQVVGTNATFTASNASGNGVITFVGGFAISSVPIFANNAAAVTGHLRVGQFYRTGGDPDPVCIVH